MIVVADASVLVAELVRARGWEFARNARLRLVVAEEQWSEARHEIDRRLQLRIERGQLTAGQASQIQQEIQALVQEQNGEVVPTHVYLHVERIARRRVPRDANDWPTVALALVLEAGILTHDDDFLGCGCPTWTFETLRSELAAA